MQRLPPRGRRSRPGATQASGAKPMNKPVMPVSAIRGEEHWTQKGADVRLFLWEKYAGDPAKTIGTILFVHGSSMASQPTFDLQVPGRSDSSAMDVFAARGFDAWCVDMEGYGRSTKTRDNNASIAYGADDCFAAASYIEKMRGKRPLLVYGISSGLVRAAPPRHGRAARARCDGVDRRRLPDACRAQQAAARVPRQEPASDRPQIRALDLRARPSRHRR